jgi:protein TonB
MRQGAFARAADAAGPERRPVMTDSVTDIIVARSQRQDRLPRMVAGSTIAHAFVFALLFLLPHGSSEPTVRQVMTISLGGPESPQTGGLTPIGGRPIQQVAPPEPQKRTEPRVAPVTPKMTIPEPKPAKTRPAPRVDRSVEKAAAQAPSTGDRVTEGSTPVETRARGTGFGLSSAGGGAGGEVQLDVSGDFCCPEYIELMVATIKRNWDQEQGRTGTSVIKFTIRRDGTLEGVSVDRTSGYPPLDGAAQRAVQLARLPRLPQAFPNPSLTVHLTFNY